jgi:hypothetical protein
MQLSFQLSSDEAEILLDAREQLVLTISLVDGHSAKEL